MVDNNIYIVHFKLIQYFKLFKLMKKSIILD